MSSLTDRVYFGIVDYVVLAVMLSGSMAIGLFFAFSGGRQRTKAEYLLAGRRMSALPVCLSLFATFQSAIALMGVPTEMYTYGTMYLYQLVAMLSSNIISMAFIVPLFYPLKLTSVYEYLEIRFESRAAQLFGAFVGVISTLSYMTIALLSPALALETAVGIPLWLSIILIGAIGTIYTAVGGIKSVIWTDVFQTFFMFTGVFTVLVKGSMDAGGPGEVWRIGKATGRVEFDSISLDPRVRHTVWNVSFGTMFYWLSTYFQQSSVQRIVSTRSIKDAYKVPVYSIPFLIVFTLVLGATGLVLNAYFNEIGCDPLEAGYIKNRNQLVPYFVLQTLQSLPGVAGLYISTIFSGALSTLSSGINALAANAVEDFLSRFLKRKSEFVTITVTKLLVCIFGAAAIGLAYIAKGLEGPVTQMTYTALGATNGPLMGLFVLGAGFPQANYIGALVGCPVGIICSLWLAVGSQFYGYPAKTLKPGPISNCSVSDVIQHPQSPANWTMGGFSLDENSTAQIDAFRYPNPTSQPLTMSSTTKWLAPEDRPFSFYDLSYVWNPLIGMLITVMVGWAISVITNPFLSKKPSPEPKLMFPFIRPLVQSRVYVLDDNYQLQDIQK